MKVLSVFLIDGGEGRNVVIAEHFVDKHKDYGYEARKKKVGWIPELFTAMNMTVAIQSFEDKSPVISESGPSKLK